jgi:HEAT repeat protein
MGKVHLLETVIEEVNRENWTFVSQYLQQFLSTESVVRDDKAHLILEMALTILTKGSFQERWEIAKLLSKLGEIVIPASIELLENEEGDPDSRWFAARILGDFDRPEVIFSLVKVLETTEDPDLATIVADSLANLGKSAVDALIELLCRSNSTLLVTRALARIRCQEAIEPLLSVVNNPDVAVRTVAIEALGSFQDPRIIPILIAALGDLAASVRKEAAIALGFRANVAERWKLLDYLTPLLYDFNLEVCQQSAIAISKIKSEGSELALFKVLQSPYTPVPLQITIIQTLSWMETLSSLNCLEKSLYDFSLEGILATIRAMSRVENNCLKTQAAEILLRFYHSGHPSINLPKIKQELAHSWKQLGNKAAIEILQQLARDREISVRLHAKAALKQFLF